MRGRKATEENTPHGTRARYNANGELKCRCEACRLANAHYHQGYRRTMAAGRQLTLELDGDAESG